MGVTGLEHLLLDYGAVPYNDPDGLLRSTVDCCCFQPTSNLGDFKQQRRGPLVSLILCTCNIPSCRNLCTCTLITHALKTSYNTHMLLDPAPKHKTKIPKQLTVSGSRSSQQSHQTSGWVCYSAHHCKSQHRPYNNHRHKTALLAHDDMQMHWQAKVKAAAAQVCLLQPYCN
jgi:hypothetical protein